MKYPIYFALVIGLMGLSNLNAQTIVGNWKDIYGNQIYLNEDARFDFFDAQNNYDFGQFAVHNDILTLYFPMTNHYIQYRVAIVSDDQLSWTDTNGQSFVVTKIPPRKRPTTPTEIAAEQQTNARLYQMMMDMNTQIHVTNMNIIENMGDSGGYWKIEDY